jgi:hypothetical protein
LSARWAAERSRHSAEAGEGQDTFGTKKKKKVLIHVFNVSHNVSSEHAVS